jgi:NTP pyrophosphatase (non-canonical NTP hydrolase)
MQVDDKRPSRIAEHRRFSECVWGARERTLGLPRPGRMVELLFLAGSLSGELVELAQAGAALEVYSKPVHSATVSKEVSMEAADVAIYSILICESLGTSSCMPPPKLAVDQSAATEACGLILNRVKKGFRDGAEDGMIEYCTQHLETVMRWAELCALKGGMELHAAIDEKWEINRNRAVFRLAVSMFDDRKSYPDELLERWRTEAGP